MTVKKDNNSF